MLIGVAVDAGEKKAINADASLNKEDESYWTRLLQTTEMSVVPT